MSNNRYPPPFSPVAARRSAAAAAPTTSQSNPGRRMDRYSKSIPPTRHRPIIEEDEQDSSVDDPPNRQHTTARRYDKNPLETRVLPRRHVHFHWLFFVGLALFILILVWLSFSTLSSMWQVQVDDWHYGRPRTYQTDAVVGHGDSQQIPSHFIAVNLNGKIMVIEVPGGDGSKSQIYLGPTLFGSGQDLASVTLSFEDRNGDGKPDLNIHIEGSDKIIVFLNNGKTFTTIQQH